MNTVKRLAYWKKIAVDALRAAGHDSADELEGVTFRNEDDLFAFFDCLRPDGAGLEKVFAGVVGGDEMIKRLRKVYKLKESSSPWGYFIVRRPARATRERLIDLTRQHLDKVKQIAISAGEDELVSLLEETPEIRITRVAVPEQVASDHHNPETIVYDVVGDWVSGLTPVESDALLMKEAFYSIACDYYIAWYLMWPLYRQSTDIEEPFAPYFDLWRHGVRPWFEKPELVTIYGERAD